MEDNVLTYARGEALTVTIDFDTGATDLRNAAGAPAL
ncbi:hypothetical protein C8N24_5855 [Solirubrobacter pauli]|uniref:Uncharacterized protein n=1 Tax=Solirubrobacter pauli TaxID=166793 RepID=A0A660L1S2_9ACTN|nr:hypothetical protein C8N24_5855 [Solirubrobacter pauli]